MRALLGYISYQPVQRWRLGPLSVSPHGVGTAAGYLVGALLAARGGERRGIPRQEVHNAVTWGAVGAILGARGFYVLAHLQNFPTLADVFKVWQGGLTMFGGFVGGLGFGLAYLRRRGVDIPRALDAAAPGFVAGVMIGRVGDLIIADHLGQPTRFFLGYRIPPGWDPAPGFGPPTYVPGAVVHQTALYDLLGLVVLGAALALLARRVPRPGTLFATFALWYGLQRFGIDFTRNRELIESNFFGLSGSQWAGLGFAAAGALALVRIHRPGPLPREAVPLGSEPTPVPPPEPAVPAGPPQPPPPAPETDPYDELELARWDEESWNPRPVDQGSPPGP